MKYFIFFLTIPFCTFSQNLKIEPFEITPEGNAIIQEVVDVPVLTKDEMFTRVKLWFAENFRSSEAVIDLEDREGGLFVGNSNTDFKYLMEDFTLYFKIRIDLKDQKFRLTLQSFETRADDGGQRKPMERYFKRPHVKRNGELRALPRKVHTTAVEAYKYVLSSLIKSLKKDEW